MSYESLPSQIDVRKLASKGAEISANVAVSDLPRFAESLAVQKGSVEVKLQFDIDEQRAKVISGDVKADVYVTCQRCLSAMPLRFESSFTLAIVWSDEEASHLPQHIEALIVGEELINLADVVEEELILTLPFINYHHHQQDECKVKPSDLFFGGEGVSEKATTSSDENRKENPFAALGALKPKAQEKK